ncbi:hypothetical protein B0T17DRAFT_119327 [Bombardia bombarda]|uniref:NmrA-like domain-containing protein n=1 Tax=Bombardia bombarda TaxID=252184 RepID=A0AA39U2W1_9PEZI|nr:hypothetical protein B0T17DRAFT_119327 [Bombardia bombarda]
MTSSNNTAIKVAVAGATGRLGLPVVAELLKAGFQVTALTRASANSDGTGPSIPPSVASVEVDYASLSSLTSALQGIDAVVSTLSSAALSSQILLIQAAAAAGVKRFIPSEFGSNTLNPKSQALPVYRDKVLVQESLREIVSRSGQEGGGLTYTLILTGPFLDYGIATGLLLHLASRSATVYDGGKTKFSSTTLATISKAVSGVLSNLEATANRVVRVHDVAVTQRELIDAAKRAVGEEGWSEKEERIEDVLKKAWEEEKHPDPNAFPGLNFIRAAVFAEGYGQWFEENDNELLGIEEMGEENISH